jgi:hypothetical protein
MTEKERSEDEPEFRAEIYDHSGPKTLGGPLIASLFFFAGGQLAKGQFLRALVLWALLGGTIALMLFASSMTDPGSTARDVVLVAGVGALCVLWFYQLWDAGWRREEPVEDPVNRASNHSY